MYVGKLRLRGQMEAPFSGQGGSSYHKGKCRNRKATIQREWIFSASENSTTNLKRKWFKALRKRSPALLDIMKAHPRASSEASVSYKRGTGDSSFTSKILCLKIKKKSLLGGDFLCDIALTNFFF